MSQMKFWLESFKVFVFITLFVKAKYSPTWESLDSRPLPQWYDDAKIGIFIHWGLYSVPAFGSEWFWYYLNASSPKYVDFMNTNYPNLKYGDFTSKFLLREFDPQRWAQMFKLSGARYVVLTSKHHEGFTLWPSRYSWMWNSFDVGPHRDIVGELANATRAVNLTFGLYHSLFEWFNPLFLLDAENSFNTSYFVLNKALPELYELVHMYAPEIIWSDGEWSASDTYWRSKEFLAYLYNESPVKDTVVVNDRWGVGCSCKHGDFWNCADRFKPDSLLNHKWENAMTLDKYSWGYRNEMSLSDVYSIEDLIAELVQTVREFSFSLGGNILINVGPTSDGAIPVIFEERLMELGEWLKINGESIFSSKPRSQAQKDVLNENVWYTEKGNKTYAICLKWPKNDTLILGAFIPKNNSVISLLGCDVEYNWTVADAKLFVDLGRTPAQCFENLKWAWVLRID